MINIIKNQPKNYKIKCSHCDCEFSYELTDLKRDYYSAFYVICPCCKNNEKHNNRLRDEISNDTI